MTAIRARKPTGLVPYPLVLLEGEEKAGKSWAAALLSKSPRVGQMYWIDLGEGGADEYGAIPGARYLVIEHDGTWASIVEQIQAVKAEAARAKAAGEPPVVLVIDSATDLWNGLKSWVDARFRRSDAGKRAIAKDADAELKPTQNLWNDANSRHRRLMTQLMTFPGIVVLTARGKEITEVKNGKPVEGSKVWSVDAQKDVPYDASVWVRMFRASKPIVIGARSVHVGIKPGEEPQPITADPENLLDWLIFDVLKVDAGTAQVRDLRHTTGGDLTEDERANDPDHDDEEPPAGRVPAPRPAKRAAPAPAARPLRSVPEAATPAEPNEVDRAADQSAALCAKRAAACSDVDTLRNTYRQAGSVLLRVDVAHALTDAQAAYVNVPDGEPIPLGKWLTACAQFVDREGMSIDDAIRAFDAEPATQEA
jgi:hypothetical protein